MIGNNQIPRAAGNVSILVACRGGVKGLLAMRPCGHPTAGTVVVRQPGRLRGVRWRPPGRAGPERSELRDLADRPEHIVLLRQDVVLEPRSVGHVGVE